MTLKSEDKSSQSFWREFIKEVRLRLRIDSREYQSVEHIFQTVFAEQNLSHADTFTSLNGDSLQYVSLSIELENYLQYLPDDWQNTPISVLEPEEVVHGV